MGLQMLQTPESDVDAGIFNLPLKFDTKKFASQWKEKGMEVEKAMQRQPLLGTRLSADGWAIFKEDGKPVSRKTAKAEYILMFRPREIQNAVHAVYGNVGMERMVQQKRNRTTGGVKLQPDLLAEDEISRASREEKQDDDGEVKFNAVEIDGAVAEVAPLQTSTT